MTPYDKLTVQRPLALVAWGCKLEMARVDRQEVIDFLRDHALKGPEGHLSKQGQYDLALIRKAEVVPGAGEGDEVRCPNQEFILNAKI